MNVLYCGDKNICDGLLVSVLSILESTSERLDVYILTASLEKDAKKYSPIPQMFADKLDAFISSTANGGSVKLFDISGLFLSELPLANLDTRFTPFSMGVNF